MLPRRRRRRYPRRTVLAVYHILDHYHGVAVLRYRVAGIHHGKPIAFHQHRRCFGRAKGIFCPDRNAVHGARRIMGRAYFCVNRRRSRSSKGGDCRYLLRLSPKPFAYKYVLIIPLCPLKRYVCKILKSHSAFLPSIIVKIYLNRFSCRRPLRIPRYAEETV